MANFAYTPPNYHTMEPYAIEAPLAQATIDPRTANAALPLLLSYMGQRGRATDDYNTQLGVVNEMQRQANMASQTNDARSRVIDALKLAGERVGGAQAVASNPLLNPLLVGTDITPLAYGAQDTATAENFSRLGTGAQGFTNAGVAPDIPSLNQRTGMNMVPGLPPIVQAAQIRAAATVAASGNGGNKVRGSYDPITNTMSLSGTRLPGETNEQFASRLSGIEGVQPRTATQPQGHVPTATAPITTNPTTSLPPQTFDANNALLALRNTNRQAYNDVLANAKRNSNKIVLDGNKLVGASGQRY